MAKTNMFLDDVEFEKLYNEIQPKLKKGRDKISVRDKERLVTAYDNGDDYVDLGDKLGINRHTVYSIIRVYRQYGKTSRGKHGGYKKPIITTEIGDKLLEFIEKRPLCQLKEMKEFLMEHHVNPSDHTISNFLHGRCVALSDEYPDLNTPEVKQRRFHYVKTILDNEITMNQCVFIGECTFNFWIKRAYGRSQKSERVYRHCCGMKNTNVTLRMAITTSGVKMHRIYKNEEEIQSLNDFIVELLQNFYDCSTIFYIVIPETSESLHNFYNCIHKIIICPSYSSFLNPVNSVIDYTKKLVKERMTPAKDVVQMTLQARKDCLKQIIDDTIVVELRHQNFDSYYSKSVKYFTKCYFKEDIIPEISFPESPSLVEEVLCKDEETSTIFVNV